MIITGMTMVSSFCIWPRKSNSNRSWDSKSTRKGDLECFPLCKSDSFPHHIRGWLTVKVPIVTKGIRLCANGLFLDTVFSDSASFHG